MCGKIQIGRSSHGTMIHRFNLLVERNVKNLQSNWALKAILSKSEKKLLWEALSFTHNNKAKTAELQGIDRTNLYGKLNKHNIHL